VKKNNKLSKKTFLIVIWNRKYFLKTTQILPILCLFSLLHCIVLFYKNAQKLL